MPIKTTYAVDIWWLTSNERQRVMKGATRHKAKAEFDFCVQHPAIRRVKLVRTDVSEKVVKRFKKREEVNLINNGPLEFKPENTFLGGFKHFWEIFFGDHTFFFFMGFVVAYNLLQLLLDVTLFLAHKLFGG